MENAMEYIFIEMLFMLPVQILHVLLFEYTRGYSEENANELSSKTR
jgi:hypothetical protein